MRPGLELSLAVLLLAAPAAAGAQTPPRFRAHPEYAVRMAKVDRIGVVPPAMQLFELTAANARVPRPEWSDRANENVAAALEALLRDGGFEAKRISASDATREELGGATQLFDAVTDAILQATYANRFPAKVERFEYSVGALERLLAEQDVDAVAFAIGFGNISSGGRMAVQALSGALSGVSSTGLDRIFVAIVDRSGAILWFDTVASTDHDLRDPKSTRSFVAKAAATIPPVPVTGR